MANCTESANADVAELRSESDTIPAPALSLRDQVSEFHRAMGQPIAFKPAVPDRERVTLRLRLIAEEFLELLDACDAPGFALEEAKHWIYETIAGCGTPSDVDIVSVADALADIDYVVEGTRLEYGIDGQPIADAVHRSNMTKKGGLVVNGKVQKPPGYRAADIRAELIAQGWEDSFPTNRGDR